MDQNLLKFGDHWSFNLRNDVKRFGFVLARYAFASRLLSSKCSLLELGCSEGIGASILSKEALSYTGVDLDQSAIQSAQSNFCPSFYTYIYDDFMGKCYGTFDAVISLDVVEHILKEHEQDYFKTLLLNVAQQGMCIVGTPNSTAAPYASEASNRGHVNLFTLERLVSTMEKDFHFVLPFGMNDETLHTGYAAMSHYLLVAAFGKK